MDRSISQLRSLRDDQAEPDHMVSATHPGDTIHRGKPMKLADIRSRLLISIGAVFVAGIMPAEDAYLIAGVRQLLWAGDTCQRSASTRDRAPALKSRASGSAVGQRLEPRGSLR
jgi:hypothetical protein